jgi:hypothetical protein
MEHPKVADLVHAMEGTKAKVYKVEAVDAGSHEDALKGIEPEHQDPQLEHICRNLDGLTSIPGLEVCERQCLSPSGNKILSGIMGPCGTRS